MEFTKYRDISERLETMAHADPDAYKLRVFLLMLLGYFFIISVLCITVALVWALAYLTVRKNGGILAIKFGIPLIALVVTIIRAFFVSSPPPEGLELKQKHAPRLFTKILGLRNALDTPAIYKVLIVSDFNASVIQRPGFAFLLTRNYLILGLPMLFALSTGQLTAVLAHELGHISRAHGRFGYWIYRAGTTWRTLLDNLEASKRWGSALFREFFEWYAPYFQAYAMAAYRAHEYEADALAVEVSNRMDHATALLGVHVRNAVYNRYWDRLWRRAEAETKVPRPYTELAATLAKTPDSAFASNIIDEIMKQPDDPFSTHPTIAQRLKAVSVEPIIPPPIEKTAASDLLGKGLTVRLAAYFDKDWNQHVGKKWLEHGAFLRGQTKRFGELEKLTVEGKATAEELLERANIIEDKSDTKKAIEAYWKAVSVDSANPIANFQLGRLLLNYDEAKAIRYLERSMHLDMGAILPANELIRDYMLDRGRHEEAQAYEDRALRQRLFLDDLNKESLKLGKNDTFVGTALSQRDIAAIREQLQAFGKIKKAFIARKTSQLMKGKYFNFLGIVPKFGTESGHVLLIKKLVKEMTFPEETTIFLVKYQSSRCRKNFLKAATRVL